MTKIFINPTRLRDRVDPETGNYFPIRSYVGNEGTLLTYLVDVKGQQVIIYKEVKTSQEVVEIQKYTKFSDARPMAKELLKKYGVRFMDEVRNKKENA